MIIVKIKCQSVKDYTTTFYSTMIFTSHSYGVKSMNKNLIKNHNWGDFNFSKKNIQVLDTTLRDGLQDAQIRHPNLEEKEKFVNLLLLNDIDAIDIAIPIAKGTHLKDAISLCKKIPANIDIVCLARTQVKDIYAAIEFAQILGRMVEVIVFCGSSPLRRRVEGWKVKDIRIWMEESVKLAVKEGLLVNVATEHTTQTEPEVLKEIYTTGLECGGKKVCIADTSGAATPISTANLINFFKTEILNSRNDIDIDWHGHNDRGLAVINSLVALEMGAKRVHATVLGLGERTGNASLEQLFINLKIARDSKRQKLMNLADLSNYASQIFNVPIPSNYPVIGEKVYRTASGIHASAEFKVKKIKKGLATPYSVVNPKWIGRSTDVVVGPLSGRSNVEWVFQRLGYEITDELVITTLETAQNLNTILSDDALMNIAHTLKMKKGNDEK